MNNEFKFYLNDLHTAHVNVFNPKLLLIIFLMSQQIIINDYIIMMINELELTRRVYSL